MSDVRPGYKQTDVGLVPRGWDVVSLGTLIGTLDAGVSVRSVPGDGVAFGHDDYVLKTSCIAGGEFFPAEAKSILPEDRSRARTPVRADTVLISRMNTPALVGEVGYVPSDHAHLFLPDRLWMAQRSPQSQVSMKWLSALLAHGAAGQALKATATGTSGSMKNIGKPALRALAIPCPPPDEQKAIAEVLGDLDELITSLEALIAKKRNIKQGAMQELLTGQRRLPGFRGEWNTKRLSELAMVDGDNLGTSIPGDYAFNYISLEDVDVGVLLSYSEQLFATAPSRARRRLLHGDVLVSTVRPNLKSHLLFKKCGGEWVSSTGFSVIRANESLLSPGFLIQYLFSKGTESQIEMLLVGSNYPAINSIDVQGLRIPAPDIKEQRAIAAMLADMDAEIAALESKLAKARAIKLGMMQVLLTGEVRLI